MAEAVAEGPGKTNGAKRTEAPASFKYAVFDLDGTLLDFEAISHVCLKEGLQGSGKEQEFTWELHASIIGMRYEAWSQKILTGLGVDQKVFTPEMYVQGYEKTLQGLYGDIKPTKGAVELVRRLKALGVKMAIATSSPGPAFEKKMKYHPEILEAMDAVVCGDDPAVKCGKPAPDIFLEAAKRINAPPEECAAFEDSPHGIRAAHDAGMFTVAIPDARLPGNDFSLADRIVSSLEEWTADLPLPGA
eukprot:TRINITY_DN44062_c0_g1_i1.p1 TRINITY_DN44062_c0_g1~~TRINITY_DN44062_c0_g1_i1.p1  ORF type:complete len:266 (-),score=47.30 TRINITY_DN44062_c0_g1_i1:68-805(-)